MTTHRATVVAVRDDTDAGCGYLVDYDVAGEGGEGGGPPAPLPDRRTVAAAAVLVASGLLDPRPASLADRGLPTPGEEFQGVVCDAAAARGADSPLADRATVARRAVVILGSGAFALEAAHRAVVGGAASVTVLCRKHEQCARGGGGGGGGRRGARARGAPRAPHTAPPSPQPSPSWIVPFSRSIGFALLLTAPLPRPWLAAAARRAAARHYRRAGIAHLAPDPGSAQAYKGQASDAWFVHGRSGALRVVFGAPAAYGAATLTTVAGETLPCDVLVCARKKRGGRGAEGALVFFRIFLGFRTLEVAFVRRAALSRPVPHRPPHRHPPSRPQSACTSTGARPSSPPSPPPPSPTCTATPSSGAAPASALRATGSGGTCPTGPSSERGGVGRGGKGGIFFSFPCSRQRPAPLPTPLTPTFSQIECFRAALDAVRAGPEAEAAFAASLTPTPFAGCRGEPLNPAHPSGVASRVAAHANALAGGRPGLPLLLARARLAGRRARATLALLILWAWEVATKRHWMDG